MLVKSGKENPQKQICLQEKDSQLGSSQSKESWGMFPNLAATSGSPATSLLTGRFTPCSWDRKWLGWNRIDSKKQEALTAYWQPIPEARLEHMLNLNYILQDLLGMAACRNIWKWCMFMHHMHLVPFNFFQCGVTSPTISSQNCPGLEEWFLQGPGPTCIAHSWHLSFEGSFEASKRSAGNPTHTTSWILPSKKKQFLELSYLMAVSKTSSSSSSCRSFCSQFSLTLSWGGHLPFKPSRTLSWLQQPQPRAWNWLAVIHIDSLIDWLTAWLTCPQLLSYDTATCYSMTSLSVQFKIGIHEWYIKFTKQNMIINQFTQLCIYIYIYILISYSKLM